MNQQNQHPDRAETPWASGRHLQVWDLGSQAYRPVWDLQKQLHRLRVQTRIPDTLLFVEHQPVYTIGKNGTDLHVIAPQQYLERQGIEVVHVDRGGDVTYHGPGQLVGYPIFNLHFHRTSISWFMRTLEAVFIEALQHWGIQAQRMDGYTGVWVGEDKIVAMGVRISRWTTMHGFAFNVNTRLEHFSGIIPCGIFHRGVTSLEQLLGQKMDMAEVKQVVLKAIQHQFGFQEVSPAVGWPKPALLNDTGESGG